MKNKRYQIYVAPKANTKLSSHLQFLANVSVMAANNLLNDYSEALKFLEAMPLACGLYQSQTPIEVELRSKLFGERYRIVFEVRQDSVLIYDIQDCRQDHEKQLL